MEKEKLRQEFMCDISSSDSIDLEEVRELSVNIGTLGASLGRDSVFDFIANNSSLENSEVTLLRNRYAREAEPEFKQGFTQKMMNMDFGAQLNAIRTIEYNSASQVQKAQRGAKRNKPFSHYNSANYKTNTTQIRIPPPLR